MAHETADWVLRDMRSPEGAFYSSLDADSQGHEGKFYVWTPREVQSLLTPQEYAAFSRRFGLDRGANFEGEWHLHTYRSLQDIAAELAQTPQAVAMLIDCARGKLLQTRNLRIWPARDEKILTAWNALMIKGLAIAARVLHRPDLAAAASAAVDFMRHHLWRDGRLLATYKDGRAHLPAYLDDYAFLADALVELLQTRWRGADLEFARRLWPRCCWISSKTPSAAGFSSPPRSMKSSFTAARHSQTNPCPPAMASLPGCSAGSDTSARRDALLGLPPSAPCRRPGPGFGNTLRRT